MPLYELVCITRAAANASRSYMPVIAANVNRLAQSKSIQTDGPITPLNSPSSPFEISSLISSETSSLEGSQSPQSGLPAQAPTTSTPGQKVLKTAALHILDSQGVVRRFDKLQVRPSDALPYRMKRHQEIFERGEYYTMEFFAAPKVMKELSRTLSYDENVIRHTMIKLGDSVRDLTNYTLPENL
ncbi:hypothetical protein DFS34DRAFT_87485 [Phlyctochytrium arcticum]|nr:hypothetical protein DFS34DRAFT_87485 [Phlyctochytrium arcticum]